LFHKGKLVQFLVGTFIDETGLGSLKEVGKDGSDLRNVVTHPDQSGGLFGWFQGFFADVIQVKHPPVGQIFHQRQIARMGGVIANVKRVVIH
jgi:hypothetical protein